MCSLLLWPASVRAAEIKLAGPAVTWFDLVVITNSVRCAAVLSETGHTVASTSEVDTCLSFLPAETAWSAWRDVPDGTLDVWIETVNDGSNVVSVLLGDPETPALTIACESDWSVLPAGALPSDEPSVPRFGVTTNRLHLALRPATGPSFTRALVETQSQNGPWIARPELIPADFGRLDAPQLIPVWSKIGVCLAGQQAALTGLQLFWRVDPTVLLLF